MRLDLEASPSAPAVLDSASRDEFMATETPPVSSNEASLRRSPAIATLPESSSRRSWPSIRRVEDAWMWLASISDYPEELMAFSNRVLAINPRKFERAVEWHAATTTLMAKTFVKRAIAAHHEGDHSLPISASSKLSPTMSNCVDAWMWRASIVSRRETNRSSASSESSR